jgi:hypothetical protein
MTTDLGVLASLYEALEEAHEDIRCKCTSAVRLIKEGHGVPFMIWVVHGFSAASRRSTPPVMYFKKVVHVLETNGTTGLPSKGHCDEMRMRCDTR